MPQGVFDPHHVGSRPGFTPVGAGALGAAEDSPAPALALRWEERSWQPHDQAADVLRSARGRSTSTYYASIPPKIAELTFELDPQALTDAADAQAGLTRFDESLNSIFQGAEVAPMPAVLLRTESASSSQIENITVRAKALALAEIGVKKYGSNASLVTANVTAMERAIAYSGDISPAAILDVHEALMHGQDHADPGRFRSEQVWIGGSDSSPLNASFVPPHQDRVEASIDDLCGFMTRTDLPLLAQAALAHAQFETIHPFNDGNGRTGRALVQMILRNGGATRRVTVPVSAGLLSHPEGYFEDLTAYRDGDPNPIIHRFSLASALAVSNGQRLVADLSRIGAEWSEVTRARRDSSVWRLLPRLLSQPAVNSRYVQQALGVSQPAADTALKRLVEVGVLSVAKRGKTGTVYVATDVTDALDEFAKRARRRFVPG